MKETDSTAVVAVVLLIHSLLQALHNRRIQQTGAGNGR